MTAERMRITKGQTEYTITCSSCGVTQSDVAYSQKQFLSAMLRAGWRGKNLVCPKCAVESRPKRERAG